MTLSLDAYKQKSSLFLGIQSEAFATLALNQQYWAVVLHTEHYTSRTSYLTSLLVSDLGDWPIAANNTAEYGKEFDFSGKFRTLP
jgi:hypothetical protein